MGKYYTFMDGEFRRDNWNSNDQGEFISGLVSVSMPFQGEKWDEVYYVIRMECERKGLHAQRVDEYVSSGIVLRDIAELIEDAEFLVFDLSEERQNVYYELGYAHGIGNAAKEVLLIAEEGSKLHYNVSGLRVHFYTSKEHLQDILTRCLAEMIRVCRR
jgi:hypothetical protein